MKLEEDNLKKLKKFEEHEQKEALKEKLKLAKY